MRKGNSDDLPKVVPHHGRSKKSLHARPLAAPLVLPLTSELRNRSPESAETAPTPSAQRDAPVTAWYPDHLEVSPCDSMEALSRSVRPHLGSGFSVILMKLLLFIYLVIFTSRHSSNIKHRDTQMTTNKRRVIVHDIIEGRVRTGKFK